MTRKAPVITIGDKIKSLRIKQGFTQFDLAIKCGLQPAVISKLENNRGNASLASLHKLAPVLGTTIDDLVSTSPAAAPVKKGKAK